MTLLSPWSIDVVIVCAVPVAEVIFTIPTPTSVSRISLFTVSFVILFLTSFTTTSPINDDWAKHFVGAGSDVGLSLFICGKSSFTGCEYFSSLKGVTVGLFVEFTSVK